MAVIASLVANLKPLAARLGVVVRALRNRREVRRLADLDAHMLKDIGLTRGQVLGALETPLLHDPSATLVDATGRSAVRRRKVVDVDAPAALTPRAAC